MKQTLYAASGLALALAGAVSASPQKMSADYLSSSRLSKRDLNAEGNYNMCKCPRSPTCASEDETRDGQQEVSSRLAGKGP